MIRLTEAWFEFKGLRSDEMGIFLKQMPVRSLPGRNVTRKTVAGRHGSLTYGDITYKDVKVRLECDVRDESKLPAILAWLTGDGLLRFSDEPGLAYDASVDAEYSRSSIQARLSGQRFTITWNCQPFRREYPEPEDLTITQALTFNNPGTAPALPRIEIRGSGDFSLTIGMQTVFFSNVVGGGIIVDSELGDALNLEGNQLANECMDGELFKIQPGYNGISWLEGGTDEEGNATPGNITAVIITPRWRYI
jgi:phage-related protein